MEKNYLRICLSVVNTVLMMVLMTFMSQSLQAQGNCLVANGGLGCSDPACEATVCAIDPFCCNNLWDSICAGEAADFCSFGPQPTCDDGIQNGNETGVDCGGPDCVPCGGVVNDDVCSALAIDCGSNQSGTTVGATLDAQGCDVSTTAPGVWYKWTGDGAQVTVSTCNAGTSYDTKLSVFSGDCEGLSCVGGNDDACGLQSSVTFTSTPGVQYYFLVHGFSLGMGNFELSLTGCSEGVPNDYVCSALAIDCGSNQSGTTVGATLDNYNCVGGSTAPGVWYTWTGDGTQVTVSTCNAGTSYDTKLSVLSGDCEGLSCVGGDDDDFGCDSGTLFSTVSSTVTFTSTPGVQYYFLVHGFNSNTGNFELSMSCEAVCDNAAEGPEVTSCPDGQELCGAQNVYWATPTATDNCVEPTVSSNYDSGDFFGVGTWNVEYIFADGTGKTATCAFTIVINPLPEIAINHNNVPEWCQGVKVLFAKVANVAALAEPLTFEWYQGNTYLGGGQELLATANGTYDVVVTDGNGCSATVSTVVNYDLSTLLSAHTIIVDDQMDMDKSTVISGGVGVLDADEVTVQHSSNIMTFMRSATAIIDGSSTVANYINSDSPVNVPAFMANPYLDNNDQVITGSVTLSGTNYGNVYVKTGGTLTIGNGEMYMKSLTMAKGSTLKFNQEGSLKIRAKMNIGPMCNVNVEGPAVVVYVGDKASVGQGSNVWVDIYAPEGLKAGDSGAYLTTYMNGLFISDDLTSGDNVVWGWNLNCGDLDNGGGGDDCFAVGAVSGALAPITKGVDGFCSTIPPPSTTCDCPPGYIVVGYEGLKGNSYGGNVISQFRLRCKELNQNGTLGNTVMVSCYNGTLTAGSSDGPVDAAPGQVMVGAQLGVGCAIDQMSGYSKPISEVIAGSPNTSSTLMPLIGGVTGNPPAVQFVPNGNVIVGMVTYLDQNPPSGYNVSGIAAGVAWRYAPVNSCDGGIPLAAAVNTTPESLDTPTDRLANLTVFPNPSSGVVNITVEDYIGKSIELAVYNILGEQVWFKHIETLEQSTLNIDLGDSRYANGLYYLNLTADGVSVSKQIVLSK